MKVFIGWSGDRSKQVALVLRQWLPNVIQQVEPWMSEEDIHAGKRWLDVLLKELEQTSFGIIALTPENARSAWILFEAGALAKQIDESAVCPYLVDIAETTDVIGPLAQFQSKKATKADHTRATQGHQRSSRRGEATRTKASRDFRALVAGLGESDK
jgi:TIR domain